MSHEALMRPGQGLAAGGDGGGAGGGPAEEVALGAPVSRYNRGHRAAHDRAWWRAFVGAGLAMFGLGLYGCTKIDGDTPFPWKQLDMDAPGTCALEVGAAGRRSLLEHVYSDRILGSSIAMFVVGVLGAFFLSGFKLKMLRDHPDRMLPLLVAFKVGFPACLGLALMAATGSFAVGGILLFVAAIGGYVIYLWRDKIQMAAQLISVSANSIRQNPGIVWISVGLQVVSVLVNVVLLTFILAAVFGDSRTEANPNLLPGTDGVGADGCQGHPVVCRDVEGSDQQECEVQHDVTAQVPCCVVTTGAFGSIYGSVAGIYLVWATFVVFFIKQYTIAGTVAQWYFSPVGTPVTGNLQRAFKHAVGPSLGSVTFAAAVLTLISLIRDKLNEMREGRGAMAVLMCFFKFFVELLLELAEALTEYSVMFTAISGQKLMDAGRETVAMFKRNFGDAFAMWAFPGAMLGSLVFFMSLVWGLTVGTATFVLTINDEYQIHATAITGVLTWIFSLFIMMYFASIVLDTTKAVFLCYCIDKDSAQVTKSDVHEVFAAVPMQKKGKEEQAEQRNQMR